MSNAPKQRECRFEAASQDIQNFNEYLVDLFEQEGNLAFPLRLFQIELDENCQQLDNGLCCFEKAGGDGSNIRYQLQIINLSLRRTEAAGGLLFVVPGTLHVHRHIEGDDKVRQELYGPEFEQKLRSLYHSLSAIKLLLLEAMTDFRDLNRETIDSDLQDIRYKDNKYMNLESPLHAKMRKAVIPLTVSGWGGRSRDGGREEFCVFISHAGEDKNTLAVPLRGALTRLNVSSFLDVAELRPGDNASASMVNAMKTAQVVVVLLSPEFGGKKWPMLELERFLLRRRGCGNAIFVLSVFYRISRRDCVKFEGFIERNRELFEKVWLFDRIEKRETSMRYVTEVMGEVGMIEGIECDGDGDREVTGLVERIVNSILKGLDDKAEKS